jgi:hypothetical protein
MRPGSYLDAFFFSVQTIATVGYGNMSPHGLYGNILTTVEIMSGIFLIAVMAGLIFVRFRGRLRGSLQQINRDRTLERPADTDGAHW